MYEEMIAVIKEIEKVSDACSEKYSVVCFKSLLDDFLNGNRREHPETGSSKKVEEETTTGTAVSTATQRPLVDSDLHLKFKQFMKKHSITIETINQVFYFEGSDILPLYDDLKTIRSSELQIRVALLQAVVTAIKSGSFEFDGEAVRAECQKRKAYDMNNYTKNFKNNSSLFEGYESYKKGDIIKLSDDGKAESAKVLMEMEK
jgi:hypothetical protein